MPNSSQEPPAYSETPNEDSKVKHILLDTYLDKSGLYLAKIAQNVWKVFEEYLTVWKRIGENIGESKIINA